MTDEYSLTIRREIAAPAVTLFDAWLDARSLSSWLRPDGIQETRAETDPRVGGAFRIVMVADESDVVHTGTYREITRPHRLVFTWSSPATQFRETLVTVTFRPSSSDSTVVEIHQVGLPDEAAQIAHHKGWSDVLVGLGRVFGETDER